MQNPRLTAFTVFKLLTGGVKFPPPRRLIEVKAFNLVNTKQLNIMKTFLEYLKFYIVTEDDSALKIAQHIICILLTDQMPLSNYLYFCRYRTICVL